MLPKYEIIKQTLLEEIKAKKFIPGDKFYSESDIKRLFNVSSITAVKVLNELTAAGYLYRIQGKGTFLSKSKVSQNVKFSDIENHSLDEEHIQVISIEKGSDANIRKLLRLKTEEDYYRIKRVRFVNDKPFLLHYTHLPNKLVKEPLSSNLSDYESVYTRIREDFNIDLFSMNSVETNEIVFPEEATILNFLNLSFREPAVKQEKFTFLPDKTVAEYIISYKHWKYFKTKIEVEAD